MSQIESSLRYSELLQHFGIKPGEAKDLKRTLYPIHPLLYYKRQIIPENDPKIVYGIIYILGVLGIVDSAAKLGLSQVAFNALCQNNIREITLHECLGYKAHLGELFSLITQGDFWSYCIVAHNGEFRYFLSQMNYKPDS